MTSEQTWHPWRRFFNLISQDKQAITYIYFYAIVAGIISLSLPLGIQAIINLVLANELSSSWVILIGVVTIGTALVGGLNIMQLAITEMIQQKVFVRASMEFAYRLPKVQMESLSRYYPPELVNRFFDTMNVQKGLPKILIDLSTAAIQMLFGLILLSFYHPFFIAFGVSLIFLLYGIFWLTGSKGMETSLEESDFKYRVAHWLEEIARTLRAFKLAGDTDLAIEKTDTYVSRYLTARKLHFKVLISQYGFVVAFKTIITAGLLILGSILLIQRQINVGQFVASEIIIITVIASVEKLIMNLDTIYDVLTGVAKIGKVTDLPLEEEGGIKVEELDSQGGISVRMDKLSFQFPGDAAPILNSITTYIRPGEKIAIVGPRGEPVSLFLHIISGLYQHYKGAVSYNDIPMGNLDLVDLRSHIGDCLRTNMLFRGTIAENLHVGRPSVDFANMRWAMNRLNLMPYIQSLPEGLNTDWVPDSSRQPDDVETKIMLARCVAMRPKLLVVDDLLFQLAPGERSQIVDFLTCPELQTVVLATHDPKIAAACDRVLVLHQGTLVAQGTFNEINQLPLSSSIFS